MQTSSSLNNQQSLKCEKQLSHWQSLLSGVSFGNQAGKSSLSGKRSMRNLLPKRKVTKTLSPSQTAPKQSYFLTEVSALVGRVGAVASKEINTRILIGLGLVLIVAPIAESLYTHFDFNDRVKPEVWYYESLFWLFLCLGPYLDKFITCLGVYYLFVNGSSLKFNIKAYLLIPPLGATLGKIIWLLQVSSDQEFHQVAPLLYVMYGCFVGASFLFTIQYLEWRYHHRERAHLTRFDTITTAHDMKLLPPEKIAEDFKTTWIEFKTKAY
jgi:hypothetical protein